MQGYEYSDETFYDSAMHTRRGQDYLITTHLLKGAEIEYQTDIYFDINGIKEPNCIYSKECKNPDRFKLMVAADGSVIPADAVGQRYIIERKNLQKVPLEIAANTTAVEENLQDGLRKFLSTPCSIGINDDEINNSGENVPQDDEVLYCGGTYKGRIINCMQEYDVKFGLNTYESVWCRVIFLQFPAGSNITFTKYRPNSRNYLGILDGFETDAVTFENFTILQFDCSVIAGSNICTAQTSVFMTVPGYNGPNWIDMLIEKGVYWNYGFHYDDKYIYLPMEELWDHYGLTQNFVRNEFYSTAYLMYEYLKTCKDNPNACMNNSILSLQHNDYTNYKLPEQTKEYLELWEL